MKIFIILFIIGYLIYKVGGFFFRILMFGAQQHFQKENNHQAHRKPHEGNVDIDYVPPANKSTVIKGGDYVDYEEIK